MVQIKYEMIRNPAFNQALSKLMHYPKFTPRTGLMIARLVERVKKEAQVAQDAFIAVVKKYAILDEKGEIAPDNGQPNTYKLREGQQEAFDKETSELGEQTFSVDMKPILLDDLSGVGLTPNELSYLEPVLAVDGAQVSPQTLPKTGLSIAPPQPEVNH